MVEYVHIMPFQLKNNLIFQSITSLLIHQSFIVIMIIILLVAGVIRFHYQPRAIVCWDEAAYIEQIYWFTNAVKNQSWDGFINVVHDTFQYPPLFSLISAFPILIIGQSIQSVRLINIGYFMMAAICIYFVANTVVLKKKRAVAFISTLFFIFSPMVIVFTSIAMREIAGAAFSLFVALCYVTARKKNPVYFLFTSVSLILLTMIKYNYGILIFVPIIINEAIEFFRKSQRIRVIAEVLIISVPYLLFMFWWIIIFQNSLPRFLYLMRNPAGFMIGIGTPWDHFKFYPVSIILMYSPSVPLGILMLVSLIIGIRYWKNSLLRFIHISTLLNIILGMIHIDNLQERYILTIIPFLFIITAQALVDIILGLNNLARKFQIGMIFNVSIFVCGIFLIIDLVNLPGLVYAVSGYVNKTPQYNQDNFREYRYNYDRSQWVFPVPPLSADKPQDVMDYIFSSVDLDKPVYFFGQANEFSISYRNIVKSDFVRSSRYPKLPYSAFAVITEILPISKFYTYDYITMNQAQLNGRSGIENDPSWSLYKSHLFKDLGVNVSIYTTQ
jgi:hypothetical protein